MVVHGMVKKSNQIHWENQYLVRFDFKFSKSVLFWFGLDFIERTMVKNNQIELIN